VLLWNIFVLLCLAHYAFHSFHQKLVPDKFKAFTVLKLRNYFVKSFLQNIKMERLQAEIQFLDREERDNFTLIFNLRDRINTTKEVQLLIKPRFIELVFSLNCFFYYGTIEYREFLNTRNNTVQIYFITTLL